MKKFIVTAIVFFVFLSGRAQGVEKQTNTSANASQIYFEAGGSGVVYSINYDGRFKKIENGLGIRIGIGGAGGAGSSYVAVPVQLNYLLGEKGKYLELGGGITYLNVKGDDYLFNNASTALANFVIGFRSQPFGKKGITWRVAFTPFIGGGNGFMPYLGASIGFRF